MPLYSLTAASYSRFQASALAVRGALRRQRGGDECLGRYGAQLEPLARGLGTRELEDVVDFSLQHAIGLPREVLAKVLTTPD